MATLRHDLAFPLGEREYEMENKGLSKLEYASIHIMSGLAAKYSLNKPEDQETISKMAVELANTLFDILEK